MVRAAAVLISLALHTAAVLVAVALAAPAAERRHPPAPPLPGPIRITVHHKPQTRQAAPEEVHRPPAAIGRGLRTNGRPQFGETLLVRAPEPPRLAAPAPPIDRFSLAAAASPPAAARVDVDGDSSRRGPPRLDPVQWSTLLLVGAGRARAPAPSEFCVPRRPAMPEAAIEQDVSGRVVARYDVGVTGQASAVEFVNRPPEALAGAVRDWLRGCLFEPALLNGRPVPVRQEQSFLFVLR